jgi:hypothetical protein
MVQGWSQTSFSQILSAPTPNKIFESLCFSASVNFKAFFDTYFVVKSHLRVQKFFVEFNDDPKTALKSKIVGKLKEFSWILLNNSKLSINFCFEILVCQKNGVSVYLVPEKCQYLRSGRILDLRAVLESSLNSTKSF